jgi:hypothetical protein
MPLDTREAIPLVSLTMKNIHKYSLLGIAVLLTALGSISVAGGQTPSRSERLVVYGDTVFFIGLGIPKSCTLSNEFKRGDRIGFRMTALNPATGKRDRATEVVVHLTYAGQTFHIPMRDRQTNEQPEREFWIAQWIVPDDAQIGVLRYTVTAKDPQGRTGEYKPFEVDASQLRIIG